MIRSSAAFLAALLGCTPLAAATDEDDEARPSVALVLSGGGARGAAHVGVLQVLEELRVPVDLVVGTSMGSIVGALYASGYSPEEMSAIMAEADWESIMSDRPARDELWFRRRQDDRRFQIDLELGFVDGSPTLPPGFISGLNVEAFLESLLWPVRTDQDFDRLRIPFRCVATDLDDGSPVVLDRGSLVMAVRASMSLPGVFSPVELDGRTLVDGGVADNVPVDVARALGADRVIVVDISSRLSDAGDLRGPFGAFGQVIQLLMNEHREAAMGSLTEQDVALVPELGDLGVMAFERSTEAIRIGYESADASRERLAEFSVDEQRWREWRRRQRRRAAPTPTIRQVLALGRSGFSSAVLRRVSGLEEGDPVDADTLAAARRRLAGLGVFERIEIGLDPSEERPDEVDVTLRPTEKQWGPHYLRFRLGASSDLRGDGEFDVGVQHTWTPLNRLGGEWRNEVQAGTLTRLFSEFYQPIDEDLRWFVAPSIGYEQDVLPLILDRRKVAELSVDGFRTGVAAGRNLGGWGEARVGFDWVWGTLSPEVAPPGLLEGRNISRGRVFAQIALDTLDKVNFPREGLFGLGRVAYTNERLGAEERNTTLELGLGHPISIGRLTVVPSVETGITLEGDGLTGQPFFLGGFQRLSGLGPRELSGQHLALGVLQTYYQLTERTTRFELATYLGASIEAAGVWAERSDYLRRDLLLGGSVFAGIDSLIGPIYLGAGFAEGGERAAYVFIGPSF